MSAPSKALLALESGQTYWGDSFGAPGEALGEIVFNTSLTGYQEILTDPSYKGQMIVMTEPHIGNVGVNSEDEESSKVYAEGLIVRDNSSSYSNWRAQKSLQEFLEERKIPAISGVDTRALTKHIRNHGAMRAIISSKDTNPGSLLKKVRNSAQMTGSDHVKDVTCSKTYKWDLPEWRWQDGREPVQSSESPYAEKMNVVVMDFGVKHNILRCLAERGCRVTVVPAGTGAEEILKMNPDGILLSNGPGDPAALTYAIDTVKKLIEKHLGAPAVPQPPLFGICLGHQILGLAFGGKTFKLKFGHRGANHPVKNLKTGKIEITTQNHGFCVDIDSLSNRDVEITHVNLNDNTLEGLAHKTAPIFSVQYHPESSAGPRDSRYLFDHFAWAMNSRSKNKF